MQRTPRFRTPKTRLTNKWGTEPGKTTDLSWGWGWAIINWKTVSSTKSSVDFLTMMDAVFGCLTGGKPGRWGKEWENSQQKKDWNPPQGNDEDDEVRSGQRELGRQGLMRGRNFATPSAKSGVFLLALENNFPGKWAYRPFSWNGWMKAQWGDL